MDLGTTSGEVRRLALSLAADKSISLRADARRPTDR